MILNNIFRKRNHTSNRPHRSGPRLKGMTLTELLIVLAVLGILVLLAYPVVMPIFQKTRSVEAKNQLQHLCKLEQAHFLEYAKYSTEFKKIGFEQSKLASDSETGTAQYRIEILEASNANFRATATAVTDFDGDGQYNVWEINKDCVPTEVVED